MKNKLKIALDYAEEKHKFQKRKGGDIPYFDHILKVVQVLQEYGADVDVLVAGALHDTIEDTDATIEEIVAMFGVEVGYMVDTVTEKKGLPYADRKKLQSLRIGGATRKIKMLKCADCIANLTDCAVEMKREGFWNMFNAPKEEIKKHYEDIIVACSELSGEKIYSHLEAVFGKVFEEDVLGYSNCEKMKGILTPSTTELFCEEEQIYDYEPLLEAKKASLLKDKTM